MLINSTENMMLIAGPCVIEDEGLILETSAELKRQLADLPVDFYFKSSFDKANRSSISSFRGPGLEKGLQILSKAKSTHGVKILTDYHTPEQADAVAEVADALQVPAFLCRQTDMIAAGAKAAIRFGRKFTVKKGQFLAPWDAKNIVHKVQEVALAEGEHPKGKVGEWFYLTERGTSFGYNTLVVDMSCFQTMQTLGVPVIYDATHAVQSPGAAAGGTVTGGKRENIEVLAKAAVAAGANGIFLECHPNPKVAKSDAANAFYLDKVGAFVKQLLDLKALVSGQPRLLPEAIAIQH